MFGLFFIVSLSSIMKKEAGHNLNFKNKFFRESNLPCHKLLSAGTTLEGNADFPFKRGLLTQGRVKFKHGGYVDGEFSST
jgi:hypothetical protein